MRTTTAISLIIGLVLILALACQASPASQVPPMEPTPTAEATLPLTSTPPAVTTPATPVPSATETPEPATPTPSEPEATPPSVETVTGTITYREKIALTADAVITVKLSDISRMDAPSVTISEQIIENPGQVPISFEVDYDPSDIDPRFTYAIQVRITEGDTLSFINDTTYAVITRDNPTNVDMVLVKVGNEPVVFEMGPCMTTLAAQLPIEFEYFGTIPTGFDGINRANCTFTKAVETVTVTLTGPANHTEVFTLEEPATQVSFPLPEGTLSIITAEIVPPGEYQREISVTSVDGDTLVVSDQPGVLETIAILDGPK